MRRFPPRRRKRFCFRATASPLWLVAQFPAPAEIVSQLAAQGPLKRKRDVEITPRSSDGIQRKGMEKSLQTVIPFTITTAAIAGLRSGKMIFR